MILLFDGRDIIEEGTGFEVPIVNYFGEIFSGSFSLCVSEQGDVVEIQKDFFMDSTAYFDLEDLRLVDDELGVWDNVAAQSKITNEPNKTGFTLKRKKGSVLNWIDLDYKLDPILSF